MSNHPGLSTCRGCGEDFLVTPDAIAQVHAAYPDEPMTDEQAGDLVNICRKCAGLEDSNADAK